MPRHGADARLMRRLASGDDSAMQELIAAHGEGLARLIGRMTAWSGSQDDLLQEVLLSVWQQADSYRGDGPLAGWLRTVAVNRCRNHRRHLLSLRRLLDSARAMLRNTEATPDLTIEATELTQYALAKLTHDDRTLIVLFYLEELPGNEVAGLLKIKPESLHVRLHRARAKLKTIIEQLES